MRSDVGADAIHLLGLVHFDENDLPKAHELISQAIELKPKDPFYNHNIGTVLSFMGQRGQAEKHFRQAIDLKPDYAEAFHSLAAVLKLKDTDPVIEQAEGLVRKRKLSSTDKCFLHFAAGKFP